LPGRDLGIPINGSQRSDAAISAIDLNGISGSSLEGMNPRRFDAVTSRFEPVMPPKIEPEAILSGRGNDVVELVKNNLLR
jgi:hypothetical protein